MTLFTAAVVGLGRVGQGYDYEERSPARVLTHASAFAAHPGFTLVGGVDPDPSARDRLTRKYRVPAWASVPDLLAAGTPDVVAIAVPTEAHHEVFQQVVAHRPKAVVCEKPLASSSSDGQAMVEAARAHGSALLVNYMRRFEPGVIDLRRRIAAGELGEIYKGVGWYTRGFLENGSHLVDLLAFLIGEIADARCLASGDGTDPDARLSLPHATAYLLAARDDATPLVQLELAGSRGVVRYLQGGLVLRIHRERPGEVFPAESVLDPDGEELETDLRRCQLHVAEALHSHLVDGTDLSSTGETALETLRACEAVLEAAREATLA